MRKGKDYVAILDGSNFERMMFCAGRDDCRGYYKENEPVKKIIVSHYNWLIEMLFIVIDCNFLNDFFEVRTFYCKF